MLTMLLHATDEDGARLSNEQVRDQALTLLFAGHDTTTSTVAFLFYELARSPEWRDRLSAEQDDLVGEGMPTGEQLFGEMPLLDQAVDETLRLYPPAWVGPRRSAVDFEFAGHRIPAGVPVNYSSWASHRLPDVFARPTRVPPRALRARGAGEAAEGRLRPVRRRPADLHRHALRPARGEARSRPDPEPVQARSRAWVGDDDPADADARVAQGGLPVIVADRWRRPLEPFQRRAHSRSSTTAGSMSRPFSVSE